MPSLMILLHRGSCPGPQGGLPLLVQASNATLLQGVGDACKCTGTTCITCLQALAWQRLALQKQPALSEATS